jgi:UDP-N-acetyl-D-mannosaminuronic acid dehydrogenase
MKTICLLGLGYIGLPTGSMFALAGKNVIGVDPDPRVQRALSSGRASIDEPELQTLVTAAIKSGRLRVQTRPEPADAFVIAVPTPLDPTTNRADLSYVQQAARDIVPFLRHGNLVVLESTVPPGTTRDLLAPILAESGLVPGRDICVAIVPSGCCLGAFSSSSSKTIGWPAGSPRPAPSARPSCTRRSSKARSCAPTRPPPRWSR